MDGIGCVPHVVNCTKNNEQKSEKVSNWLQTCEKITNKDVLTINNCDSNQIQVKCAVRFNTMSYIAQRQMNKW